MRKLLATTLCVLGLSAFAAAPITTYRGAFVGNGYGITNIPLTAIPNLDANLYGTNGVKITAVQGTNYALSVTGVSTNPADGSAVFTGNGAGLTNVVQDNLSTTVPMLIASMSRKALELANTNQWFGTGGGMLGVEYFIPGPTYSGTPSFYAGDMGFNAPVLAPLVGPTMYGYFITALSSHQTSLGSIPWSVSTLDATNGPSLALDPSCQFIELVYGQYKQTGYPTFYADNSNVVWQSMNWIHGHLRNSIVTNVACVSGWQDETSSIEEEQPSGYDLMTSLETFRAWQRLSEMSSVLGDYTSATNYLTRCEAMRQSLATNMWDSVTNLYWAYERTQRVNHVFGSAFAVYLGATTKPIHDAIVKKFVDAWGSDTLYQCCAPRHLPKPQQWSNPVYSDGEFQNGGYLPEFAGWVFYTLKEARPDLAEQAILQYWQQANKSQFPDWWNTNTPAAGGTNYLLSVCGPLSVLLDGKKMPIAVEGSGDIEYTFPVENTLHTNNQAGGLIEFVFAVSPTTFGDPFTVKVSSAKGDVTNSQSWIYTGGEADATIGCRLLVPRDGRYWWEDGGAASVGVSGLSFFFNHQSR